MVLGFATRMYLAAPRPRARHAGRALGTSAPVTSSTTTSSGTGATRSERCARSRASKASRSRSATAAFSFKAAYRERMRLEPNLAHIVLRLR